MRCRLIRDLPVERCHGARQGRVFEVVYFEPHKPGRFSSRRVFFRVDTGELVGAFIGHEAELHDCNDMRCRNCGDTGIDPDDQHEGRPTGKACDCVAGAALMEIRRQEEDYGG